MQPVQIPQSAQIGDLVELRCQRWRIVDVRAYPDCQLVTVAGIGHANRNREQRFLFPFDRPIPLDRPRTVRRVSAGRWRRTLRALIADDHPPDGLCAARDLRVDLMAHQLEPALAIVRGLGTRVLLADDVGLGKTIQAGLIVAELKARGLADRVLILTPSGLRDQWEAELRDRFGIAAVVATMRDLRRRLAELPVGLNPWTTIPVAIASIDYVKRPEILQAAGGRWDVVIVDEAHGTGPGTDRYAAASALAARAAFVLLLTATPHNGDPATFEALCRIGALGDELLMFRRTKDQLRLGAGRHVHTLAVRPSATEMRMHAVLAEFAAAVRAEHDSPQAWIALTVLHKRAFSAARSLELTVARRLDTLGGQTSEGSHQLVLPLIDEGELDPSDEAPDCLSIVALADSGREQRLLHRLLDAAHASTGSDRKIAATRRLLRRISEPVVVFTEYRDTLQHLQRALDEPAALLHGGMGREQRASALHDFITCRRRILLATDAAGEGLNLHQRCRTVINLELPWNPMRLEQRIGRVDRIGQRRRVHVFHLVGTATGEVRVLQYLRARIARAVADVGSVNPLDDERMTARFVVDGGSSDAEDRGAVIERGRDSSVRPLAVNLAVDAQAEVARLTTGRLLSTAADRAALAALEVSGPWLTRTRSSRTRTRLAGRLIALVRVENEDDSGRRSASSLVPIAFAVRRSPLETAAQSRLLLNGAVREIEQLAETISAGHSDRFAIVSKLTELLRERRRRIASDLSTRAAALIQPGLFDRRADRTEAADRAADDHTGVPPHARIDLGTNGSIVRPRARLLLLLTP